MTVRQVSGQQTVLKYAVLPLPAKVAAGQRGSGAESFGEVYAAGGEKLQKAMHVATPDGSPALHAVARARGVPSARGVSHFTHLFTPLSRIPKEGLSREQDHLLRSLMKGKQPLVKADKSAFIVVGGDQVAEAITGVGKSQLRRLGLLGRRQGRHEHAPILAAHYLNKNPGLDSVLRALAMFRRQMAGTSPRSAFSKPSWKV